MSSKEPTQGKGSKSRITDFRKFQANFPKSMGPDKRKKKGACCKNEDRNCGDLGF